MFLYSYKYIQTNNESITLGVIERIYLNIFTLESLGKINSEELSGMIRELFFQPVDGD